MRRDVIAALHAAGWDPDGRDDARARRWALDLAGYATPDGRTHVVVPPALDVFAVYGGLDVPPADDGEQVAPAGFRIDPSRVLATVTTLATLGGRLNTSLTPIGDEGGGTGVLAVDADGRVFVLDHSGEWFLGDGIDAALDTLVLGHRPPRLRRDGSW